ncbi:sodium channel modifier 1 [Elysia marginata]|uniref:Sodium channel modifier 1 n=1 Tax=Elysia marginata TaxID=1093978 RepID=A0AAV4H9K3_9GAST|nr:sodium channel modifier 1 [Elysia marginata]
MSFKREGNDSNLLSKLRKRRIGELLGENIPKDEAKLLSNGRFTCTVCHSVPIFDTVSMLVVHRQGKKHLANQQVHERRQRELKELIAKRKHQQFLKDGTTFIPITVPASSGNLSSSPYDPCVKKTKTQPTERKPRINLQTSSSFGSNRPQEDQNLHTKSTYSPHLASLVLSPEVSSSSKPSLSSMSDIASRQLSGPIIHDHQLKNLFGKNGGEKEPSISPYCRKRRPETDITVSSKPSTTAASTSSFVTSPQVPSSHSLSQFSQFLSPSSSKHRNLDTSDIHSSHPHATGSCSQPTQQQSSIQLSQPKVSPKSTTANSLREQKLRQLQGSGWKKDWDGKWIKDEDAEFDSDEEPPDIV